MDLRETYAEAKNKKGRAGWTGRGGTLSGETRAGQKRVFHNLGLNASEDLPLFVKIDPAVIEAIVAAGGKWPGIDRVLER